MTKTKCVICDVRPVNGNPEGMCAHCYARVERERQIHRPEKPYRYVTYQGQVVGIFRSQNNGKLFPRLLKRSPDRLQKSITLDLNCYLEGFSRDQIKKLKKCVLQFTHI